ncbi:hypothetical protein BGZ54_009416 [Gamsiella multidivaricata]|nr:hypothetical protein BGZ54_009416 [Gamsiella multidivaricata]
MTRRHQPVPRHLRGSRSILEDENRDRALDRHHAKRTKTQHAQDDDDDDGDDDGDENDDEEEEQQQDIEVKEETTDFPTSVFEILDQAGSWYNRISKVDFVKTFETYKRQIRGAHGLAKQDIMDLTGRSKFISSMTDSVYESALDELPLMGLREEDDDVSLIFGRCSKFEDVKEWSLKNLMNTPNRRLIMLLVDIWSDHYHCKEEMPETQVIHDFLSIVISNAFRGVGMTTLTGNIPLPAANNPHHADIMVKSKDEQVCIVLASATHGCEPEKLACMLHHLWVLKAEKSSDTRRLPKGMTTFGMQLFGSTLHFYQFDFCGRYRFYEVGSVEVPLQMTDFVERTPSYVRAVADFAARVRKEVDRCQSTALLSQRDRLIRAKAILSIP